MDIKTNHFNPFIVNTMILSAKGRGDCIIVDPGMSSPQDVGTMEKALEGFVPKAIILTHSHEDHTVGIPAILSKYDIPVYLHADDVPGLKTKVGTLPVNDGDTMTIAGLTFKVLHTPGHSRGGVCYLFEDSATLISGDTLFRETIGRSDLTGGDYDVLMDSITRKLLVLPPDTAVYPGHGPSTTIGHEMTDNPFLQPWDLQEEELPDDAAPIELHPTNL